MQRRYLLSRFSLGCLSSFAFLPALATQPPALWLANPYLGNETLTVSPSTKTWRDKLAQN